MDVAQRATDSGAPALDKLNWLLVFFWFLYVWCFHLNLKRVRPHWQAIPAMVDSDSIVLFVLLFI